ncbi:RidA family protein [Paenibacillus contaminans]|uniref:RidA family protein n=1 Tax=Paenibacillus contaminans TaxID=450362 RepID=A0A329MZ99_9BACL|nr:RidA family protein [Paenibacillus contaminans]RAV22887.1 RidA family protein [Paenibacillus contaminans]
MKQEICTGVKLDKPFSSGIETESYVFVSGQGGIKDGKIVGEDIESQTVQTMENIREVLTAAGLDLAHIVKVQVYLSDRALYNEFNRVYDSFFQAPFPARTTIYCDLNYDLLVEIDAIAVKAK